jgi:diaminohydroxyphosphoribosylaminopyrimidine deaminase/5-amino-6-(5-phosphoribosylamino)uracil reductase
MEQQAEELNRAFLYYSREGNPYITLKLASTLDGRIAAPDGNSKWITGGKARGAVHRLRGQVDAILVGVGTILADDPTLTARGVDRKLQPLRIVLDPDLKTPLDSTVVKENSGGSTLLVISDVVRADRCKPYETRGVGLIRQATVGGFFTWKGLAGPLIEMGVLHVLVEGGGKTAGWILRENAANRIELFLAPRIIGSSGVAVVGDVGVKFLKDALPLSFSRIRRLGEDIQITADIK